MMVSKAVPLIHLIIIKAVSGTGAAVQDTKDITRRGESCLGEWVLHLEDVITVEGVAVGVDG